MGTREASERAVGTAGNVATLLGRTAAELSFTPIV
jgi:hypothetical protein